MRVLVCQTPRLTYVQAIELLQYETANATVDLAMFPEMCMEHPPQLSEQGELTLENVALMMLSKWCKQQKTCVLLGSVEERGADGRNFDTCIAFDRDGEIMTLYRKQSVFPPKTAGDEPGFFRMEQGLVGVLLGAEVEEEERWQSVLEKSPILVVNPCRAPQSMDVALVRAHPELQVVSWHRSFCKVERIVETKMRNYQCSFIRADAPLNEGGAGSSILIEPHRSILPSSWSPQAFVVETLPPYDLHARKLPGWRPLAIDELVKAATVDRALLTHEELERGPRFHLWSMRPDRPLLIRGLHWGLSMRIAKQNQHKNGMVLDKDANGKPMLEELLGFGPERACVVELTSKDGRQFDAVATSKGKLILWDLKLKTLFAQVNLASASPTAAGPGRHASHFVLAASTNDGFWLRVFDTNEIVTSVSFSREDLPWKHWQSSELAVAQSRANPAGVTVSAEPTTREEGKQSFSLSRLGTFVNAESRRPAIRDVFQLNNTTAFVVVEIAYGQAMPQGLLINLESVQMDPVNIYGDGPPPPEEGDEENADEDDEEKEKKDKGGPLGADKDVISPPEQRVLRPAPLPIGFFADRLVQVQVLEQKFHDREKATPVLICLYTSNRIIHVTLSGTFRWKELTLLEDSATNRQRKDMPLAFSALATQHSGFYHLIVSYTSGALKWWQVSMDQCKLQAQTALTYAVTKLSVIEWFAHGGAAAASNQDFRQKSHAHVPAAHMAPLQVAPAKPPGPCPDNQFVRQHSNHYHQVNHFHKRKIITADGSYKDPVKIIPASLRHRASLSSARGPAMPPLPPLSARGAASPSRSTSPAAAGNGGVSSRSASRHGKRPSDASLSPLDGGGPADRTVPSPPASARAGTSSRRGSTPKASGGASDKQSLGGATSHRRPGTSSTRRPGGNGGAVGIPYAGGGGDSFVVLVGAVDSSGGLLLFLGRSARLVKVYSAAEHFSDKVVSAEAVICSSKGITVLQSTGELRFLEFVYEDQVISLMDVPLADNIVKYA